MREEHLFADTGGKSTLRLVDTNTTGTGIVILTYRPARDVAAG